MSKKLKAMHQTLTRKRNCAYIMADAFTDE